MTTNLSVSIEKIAYLIKSLNQTQKNQLLQLVPELKTLPTEETDISEEQAELMAYFRNKSDDLAVSRPLQDDDKFLADLTVREFFTLSEKEQTQLWKDAHQKYDHNTVADERSIHTDALSS